MDQESVANSLEAWKVTIQVQQHFNDIEMRVRNFASTLLVAVLGAAAVAIESGKEVPLFGWDISLASVILAAGTIGWLAFYFVDRFWYHPLLLGAVSHGEELEKLLKDDVPGIGLTGAIRVASPLKLGKREIRSSRKVSIFYLVVALLLVILALALHGVADQDEATPERPSEPTPTTSAHSLRHW